MTGLGNPYERNSDYVIASAKHDAWDEGFLQGRRYQHQEDVEWLEKHLSRRKEIPFNDGSYWERYIRDEDVEAFKNMEIK